MSEVLQFQKPEDRNVARVMDEMWALVEKEDVLAGITACMHTLAALLAAHGAMHPQAVGLPERCADLLKERVAALSKAMP